MRDVFDSESLTMRHVNSESFQRSQKRFGLAEVSMSFNKEITAMLAF